MYEVKCSRKWLANTSHLPHVQRGIYRLSCYEKAHISIFERIKPYDEDQGWVCGETHVIEPLLTKGSILPQSVIDLLGTENNDEEDIDDEIEPEVPSDYEEMRWDEMEDYYKPSSILILRCRNRSLKG